MKQHLDQAIDQARSGGAVSGMRRLTRGHGRVEVRRYWITEAIDWLEDKARWCGLRSIGAVESERHIGGQVSVEWRYFIASIEADAKVFARAVRSHWGLRTSCTGVWTSPFAKMIVGCARGTRRRIWP